MKIQRKYGCLKDKRFKLDRIYRPTPRAVQQFPAAFDLGATPNPAFGLLNQGELGSCTGFGLKRLAWYGLNSHGHTVEPSALFIYYCERLLENDVAEDNGASISDGIDALLKYGVCPEADWPYIVSKFAQPPPESAFTDALNFQALVKERINTDSNLVQNIKDALFNQRLPVVFGADVFPGFESDAAMATGLVPMPASGDSPLGGHCMVIRGWNNNAQDGPRFKIANSWGSAGDNGCMWLLFQYLQQFSSDLWAIPQME